MPLLEVLSALSRAHAFGNLRTGVLPDSIRQWTEMNVSLLAFGLRGAQNISTNLERAGTLRQAIADGQLSPEFLGLLADSIGVNQQAIEQRLAERKADGVVGNETNTEASLPAALADASFAIAPLGPGKREITQAPDPVSVSDPFPSDLKQPSQLRNHFWKNFAGITKGWPEIIQTPEGPIAWSKSKAGNKLRSFKDGEPAHLHYIAAAHLPELLANSRLASVHEEAKGDRTVQEIHRRYAWVDFPNGQRRHVLLTVERMSEHADKDKQNADQAYSAEILGVSLEVLPENEGAGVVNLKIGGETGSPSNQAITPARDNLASFLSGIKPEHRFDPASSSTSAKSHPPLDPTKLTDLIDTDSEASFSIGSDPSSGDSEARINEATVEARKKVATADAESIKRAGRFWLSLHGEKGVTQLPELRSKNLADLVKEASRVQKGLSIESSDHIGGDHYIGIGDANGFAYIIERDGQVWVDTSMAAGRETYGRNRHENRKKGSMGPAIYQIAQAYARNNGLKFVPDTSVSPIAIFRRWPHLLSSAIRMGDTSHIGGAKDVEGWKEGDHEHNAGLLALHEYEYVRHFFPEIDHLHLSDDSSTIIDDAGAPVPESALEDLLVGERHPKRLGVGQTTLRRAIVTGQTTIEGRLEPESETGGSQQGERRIHSGAVQDFRPDLGSRDSGTRPREHALREISYSIGTDVTPAQRKQAEETAYRHTATSRIANTDDVRPLLPGYKEADPLTRDAEYHKLASAINHLTIDRLLADEPNGEPVVILAGGAGSGKTTASGIGTGFVSMDFAIDTVMGWENAMEDLQARVRNSGRDTGFIYVYTPFEKALPRVIERFLDKTSDPRLVPLAAVVDGHLGAQQNVLNASDNFSIRIIDNSGDKGQQRIIDKAELQKYDYLRESGREETGSGEEDGSDRTKHDRQHQPPSGGKGTEGARERARARLLAEGREILKRYQREGKLTQREVDAFLQEGEFAISP